MEKIEIILKIFSTLILLLIVVIYFTITKKKYIDKILNLLFVYRFSLNMNYGQINAMYFLFRLITGFIGMLLIVYLKLAITGTLNILVYNPKNFQYNYYGSCYYHDFFSMVILIMDLLICY